MAWPLRMFDSRALYFVTVRCFQGRLLLRPSRETNEVLAGVLARAARLSSIELFGFAFASNHFHLIVRAPEGNLPRFMQFLLSNVSKKVGWIVGWRGAFWERRYSAEPILDDEALLGRLRYVLAHGVKEGLVRRCSEWPGLTSLAMALGASTRTARWFNWTRRWRRREGMEAHRFSGEWSEEEQLTLSTLPSLAARSQAAKRAIYRRAVAAIEEEAALRHPEVLGVAAVLEQSPQTRPARPARRPRPLCHAATRKIREMFRERFRDFVALYRDASLNWRNGNFRVTFPEGAFRPPLWPMSPRSAAAA